MEDLKPWYQSRAIWGALIGLLSSAVLVTGHSIAPEIQNQLVDTLASAGTVFGSLVSLYGRFAATQKIG